MKATEGNPLSCRTHSALPDAVPTAIGYVLCCVMLLSQLNLSAQNVLPFEEFMMIVGQHHPIAVQASLNIEQGRATVQMARGGFDPKIGTDLSQKYFAGDRYYSLLDAGLKVPTWFGVELSAGYEQNSGMYLNPEHYTSGGGLAYAGISLPLGKGLFMDDRRAALLKAKVFQRSTQAQQRIMLNELYFKAGKAYWNWFRTYQTLIIYKEAVELAEFRLNAIKDEVLLGNRPKVDTLEASIQLQNRYVGLQQAQLELDNAVAFLETHLWKEGQLPLELQENTVPVDEATVQERLPEWIGKQLLDSLIDDHPYLQNYRLKIEELKIERRLKMEGFKPQVDLKYNPLHKVVGSNPLSGLSANNFKWGVTFSMPIPLRKERGAYKLTSIKIRNAKMDLALKTAEIRYRVTGMFNQLNTVQQQAGLYQRTVNDYRTLLETERVKFNAGESSLFLVNAREMGYIDTRVKYVKMLSSAAITYLELQYELGTLDPTAP